MALLWLRYGFVFAFDVASPWLRRGFVAVSLWPRRGFVVTALWLLCGRGCGCSYACDMAVALVYCRCGAERFTGRNKTERIIKRPSQLQTGVVTLAPLYIPT